MGVRGCSPYLRRPSLPKSKPPPMYSARHFVWDSVEVADVEISWSVLGISFFGNFGRLYSFLLGIACVGLLFVAFLFLAEFNCDVSLVVE